jgi:hypothetical protein
LEHLLTLCSVFEAKKEALLPHFCKYLDDGIPGANSTEQGQSPLTGERNEMEMAASVLANEFVGHRVQEKANLRPFETRKGSATRKS